MSDLVLVKFQQARLALATCKTALEAKSIADAAEAARVYMRRTNASNDMVNQATEIRILAERQMGEFLTRMPKAKGGDTFHKESTAPREGAVMTLAEIGIDDHESARAQKLAKIPTEAFFQRLEAAKNSGGKLTTAAIITEPKREEKYVLQARGLMMARGAVQHLKEILPTDGERIAGITHVRDWCNDQLQENQGEK